MSGHTCLEVYRDEVSLFFLSSSSINLEAKEISLDNREALHSIKPSVSLPNPSAIDSAQGQGRSLSDNQVTGFQNRVNAHISSATSLSDIFPLSSSKPADIHQTPNMSSGKKQSTNQITNGASKGLNAGSLSHVPDTNNGSIVDRFSQSTAADEPYFARARMQDRSEHVSRLSNQLDATDEIMKK